MPIFYADNEYQLYLAIRLAVLAWQTGKALKLKNHQLLNRSLPAAKRVVKVLHKSISLPFSKKYQISAFRHMNIYLCFTLITNINFI
jgi:methionine-rich copper-binding protein CopC